MWSGLLEQESDLFELLDLEECLECDPDIEECLDCDSDFPLNDTFLLGLDSVLVHLHGMGVLSLFLPLSSTLLTTLCNCCSASRGVCSEGSDSACAAKLLLYVCVSVFVFANVALACAIRQNSLHLVTNPTNVCSFMLCAKSTNWGETHILNNSILVSSLTPSLWHALDNLDANVSRLSESFIFVFIIVEYVEAFSGFPNLSRNAFFKSP